MEYKIYNYTKDVAPERYSEAPFDVNYNLLGLHKKRTFVKGELISVEYYGQYDFDNKIYSDLVLTEDRIFHRDSDLLAYKRDMVVSWYALDDTKGEVKATIKYYSPDESIKEGIRRRGNVISNVKLAIFFLLGKVDAYDLLNEVFTELSLYKDGFRQPLMDKLATLPNDYLDNNLVAPGFPARAYLISELAL